MKLKKELITQRDPKSPVSEVFRTLRTNIQFMSTNKKLKTLLITSTFPSEGKSWVASNLAVTFAQAGNKVILIDADMRKGRQYTIFGASPRPGLSNYLSGVNDNKFEVQDLANYIRVTKVPNLYLLPSGNVPPNPSELLTTQKMVNLLNELKSEFDLVIIDGTPSKLVTDAVILSRLVDSTIIVTGHNMAKKDDLAKVVRDIKNVGGNIAGVVYNQKPSSGKKANEIYYYASTSAKMDARKRQEIEAMQRRQAQRARTNEMLNRDRKPEEYLKNVIKEVENDEKTKMNSNSNSNSNLNGNLNSNLNRNRNSEPKIQNNNSNTLFENGKTPEERATEMLNQFNSYLQKEKENRDKRNF